MDFGPINNWTTVHYYLSEAEFKSSKSPAQGGRPRQKSAIQPPTYSASNGLVGGACGQLDLGSITIFRGRKERRETVSTTSRSVCYKMTE